MKAKFSVEKGIYKRTPCATFVVQGNMEENIRKELRGLGYELDVDISNRYIKRIFEQVDAQNLSAKMKIMAAAGKII